MNLKYTLCFIRYQDAVLLQYRRKPPNQDRWNGVGGRIEPGETPKQCVLREVQEETNIALTDARFAGLVTWEGAPETGRSGMYVYLADLPKWLTPGLVERLDLPDGWLTWVPVDELDREPEIVDNIPHFLPAMQCDEEPIEYRCTYHPDGSLAGVERRPLSISLEGVA